MLRTTQLRFPSPYSQTPHPIARKAAEELMQEMHQYMNEHSDSELHRRGKMFGVLVARRPSTSGESESTEPIICLRAFSAMLDGTYHHTGFVPPVYEADHVVGANREDSRDKQKWLFRQYRMLNAQGEEKDLMEIFRDTPRVMSEDEFFSAKNAGAKSPSERGTSEGGTDEGGTSEGGVGEVMPPAGAGECCAPKLLQEAFRQGLEPLCMAEFWIGASPKDELRIDGQYYPACSGKCRPILKHMLAGCDVEDDPEWTAGKDVAETTQVLYEDEWMWIVSKPAGLLSVPGKDNAYSLQTYLQERLGQPAYAVHRLDMDTSGIIVFAKTQEAASTLQTLFLRRDIHKLYIAELEPSFNPCQTCMAAEGTIRLPLLPNPLDRPRQMVHHEHGKVAITHYRLTNQRGSHGGVLVELRPETGRTHQLRVHCAHIDGLGVPILGDRLYGFSNIPAERLMLHAAELRFTHPFTGKEIEIVAPPTFPS